MVISVRWSACGVQLSILTIMIFLNYGLVLLINTRMAASFFDNYHLDKIICCSGDKFVALGRRAASGATVAA